MADTPIRNNSPDPTDYHQAVEGMPGTMLPRSGSEGRSLGFDHNKPRTVIVDPGEEGGGFSLDLSALGNEQTKLKFNSAAMKAEVMDDPTTFYRGISDGLKDQESAVTYPDPQTQVKELQMPKQLKPLPKPKTVPTPGVVLSDEISEIPEEMQDVQDHIQQLLQEELAKAEATKAQKPDPTEYLSRNAQEMAVLRSGINKQGEAINALIEMVGNFQHPEPTVEEKPKDVNPRKDEAEPGPPNPFERLGIPFFQSEKPTRPTYETYFEMPKMGTMAARYHAVVAGQDCLALIYDTRFEDGFQYLPPNLGEEKMQVSVPKHKDAVYTCSSLGLHWTLGCLDVVILIRHPTNGVE